MKSILLALLLTASMGAYAETTTWGEAYLQGETTKVGAVYAAICNACMGGDYISQSTGSWQCVAVPEGQGRECASKLVEAMLGNYEGK